MHFFQKTSVLSIVLCLIVPMLPSVRIHNRSGKDLCISLHKARKHKTIKNPITYQQLIDFRVRKLVYMWGILLSGNGPNEFFDIEQDFFMTGEIAELDTSCCIIAFYFVSDGLKVESGCPVVVASLDCIDDSSEQCIEIFNRNGIPDLRVGGVSLLNFFVHDDSDELSSEVEESVNKKKIHFNLSAEATRFRIDDFFSPRKSPQSKDKPLKH